MALIETTGTRTKVDLDMLRFSSGSKGLGFSGSTLPTTLEVGFINSAGTFQAFTGGAITALPSTFNVERVPGQGLALNVDGGSPDFSIDLVGNGE